MFRANDENMLTMQNCLDPENKGKILGGCATVAGWGQHFDVRGHFSNWAGCLTNTHPTSPDKAS